MWLKIREDRVAQIITFGTWQPGGLWGMWADINMPYGEVDYIAKQIPMELGHDHFKRPWR